jgi:hypothetical protein
VLTGVIHEDSAHHLGGYAEEVVAIDPFHLTLVYQTKAGFMDQGSCLQGVVDTFTPQVTGSKPPKLIVDLRN